MKHRYPKGPGSIHGWSTTCRPDFGPNMSLVYGARLTYWAALAAVLVALVLR